MVLSMCLNVVSAHRVRQRLSESFAAGQSPEHSFRVISANINSKSNKMDKLRFDMTIVKHSGLFSHFFSDYCIRNQLTVRPDFHPLTISRPHLVTYPSRHVVRS